ncbi:MAG: SagB/ThcOx family dehydrogenase [Armatimonadota bacterium]
MRRLRIRRARGLVGFWENGEFVLENYLTGRQTTVAPLVAQVLQTLDHYVAKDTLLRHFAPIPHAPQLVDQLISQDVLVVEGSSVDEKERLLDKQWVWKQDARHFHYGTQHLTFEESPEVQRASLAQRAREVAPPSPFKDRGQAAIKLAGSFEEQVGEFWDVLSKRRTRRQFARQTISAHDFSTILLWTWGRTHTIFDLAVGSYILKTSPSGGARHPIEVYPVVLRVKGIRSGIYHYSVRRHGMQLLRPGLFEDLVVRLCANQVWVGDAAVVFFMTAVVTRSMWKYSQSHAYRVLLLDAGHLGQTFHLVCTRLGLAPFTTAATRDMEIERELGLDGVSEIAVYTAATGIPAKTYTRLVGPE